MASTHADLEMNDIRPVRDLDERDDHAGNATLPLLAGEQDYDTRNDDDPIHSPKDSRSIYQRVCPAGIASLTVQVPDARKGTYTNAKRQLSGNGKLKISIKPSRWNTTEFYCYYAIVILYLLLMIRTTVRLSTRE